MNYFVYRFHLLPQKPTGEILISLLADLPFESFQDTPEGFDAFIPESLDDPEAVGGLIAKWNHLGDLRFTRELIPDQNWNAVWESDYPVVAIGKRCLVRAPFHESDTTYEMEIVINPQMSFGTGHHATTYLMLSMLLDLDLHGKYVLDMGSGTGVLAIATALRGAILVEAVDIEEWAYRNTLDNAALNGVDIRVVQGDVKMIDGATFDIILANINKNVLLADMQHYAATLHPGGIILLSGFFEPDVKEILAEAGKYALHHTVTETKDGWAALKLIKDK